MNISGYIDSEDAEDLVEGQMSKCFECGDTDLDYELEFRSFRAMSRKHKVKIDVECDCGWSKWLSTHVKIDLRVEESDSE